MTNDEQIIERVKNLLKNDNAEILEEVCSRLEMGGRQKREGQTRTSSTSICVASFALDKYSIKREARHADARNGYTS